MAHTKAFIMGKYGIVKVLMLAVVVLLAMTGCHGLDMGVGVRGIMLEDHMMTLDGDTFTINGRIGDKMLIVYDCEHPDDAEPYYLLKQERNGFYYPQIRAASMCAIDNTTDFVCVGNRDIYDIKTKKLLLTSPCDVLDLSYLGKWKDKLLFANIDTLFFSDGKCIGLQDDVHYNTTKANGKITLVDGAQKINVSFADLYNAKMVAGEENDSSVERFTRDYYIKPMTDYDDVDAGFWVRLDIPKGNSKADMAVRQWMTRAIVDDAFSLLECQKVMSSANIRTLGEMKSSLDRYGELWEKLFRAEYQVGDTIVVGVGLTCDVEVRKVADCDDYVTYRYWTSIYDGGLHNVPRSYYVTYDKRRDVLLDVANSVKPNLMQTFRKKVLKSLKPVYDAWNGKSTWDEFTWNIFSFHSSFDTSGMDKAVQAMLDHRYTCDEWAGWDENNGEAFTEKNFPLAHFAILPEGVVLTYHLYQIGCFAAGEYHAVVPFEEAGSCLRFDYSRHKDLMPGLRRFIK